MKEFNINDGIEETVVKETRKFIKLNAEKLYRDKRDVNYLAPYEIMRLVDFVSEGHFADVVKYIPLTDKTFGTNKEQVISSVSKYLSENMPVLMKDRFIGTAIATETEMDFDFYFTECGFYSDNSMADGAMRLFNERYIYSNGKMKRKPYIDYFDFAK